MAQRDEGSAGFDYQERLQQSRLRNCDAITGLSATPLAGSRAKPLLTPGPKSKPKRKKSDWTRNKPKRERDAAQKNREKMAEKKLFEQRKALEQRQYGAFQAAAEDEEEEPPAKKARLAEPARLAQADPTDTFAKKPRGLAADLFGEDDAGLEGEDDAPAGDAEPDAGFDAEAPEAPAAPADTQPPVEAPADQADPPAPVAAPEPESPIAPVVSVGAPLAPAFQEEAPLPVVAKLPATREELEDQEQPAYDVLQTWAETTAQRLNVPLAMILLPRTMAELVRLMPRRDQLLKAWGMSPKRAKEHGDGIVEALNPFREVLGSRA